MSEFTSVTRCPYCRTSFHLGPLQLHAAGGKVRCGACLNVFDAKSHFLVEQKYLFDTPPPEVPTAGDEIIDSILNDESSMADDDLYPMMTPAPPQRPANKLWGLLALLAILALPAQLFWWQPQALFEYSWYQNFLRSNCDWLPCETTDFRDIEYLSLTGLIQPSDTHKQVLTAVLELRNQAPLPQPFPSLSLRFMNIRGELVSARIFETAEYLQNGANSRRLMPPDSRVQIQLEIYDPGGQAISYEFEPLYLASADQR